MNRPCEWERVKTASRVGTRASRLPPLPQKAVIAAVVAVRVLWERRKPRCSAPSSIATNRSRPKSLHALGEHLDRIADAHHAAAARDEVLAESDAVRRAAIGRQRAQWF